jgi:cytoskeletal protein RodZ
MTRGVEFSKASFITFISIGFIIILVIGLLCGLIARPKNCIESSNTIVTTSSTSSSISASSSSVSTLTTSSSSTASTSSIASISTTSTTTTSTTTTSTTTTSTTTTSTTSKSTTTLANFYTLTLRSLASLVSNVTTKGSIPNTNINVTLIENAVCRKFYF